MIINPRASKVDRQHFEQLPESQSNVYSVAGYVERAYRKGKHLEELIVGEDDFIDGLTKSGKYQKKRFAYVSVKIEGEVFTTVRFRTIEDANKYADLIDNLANGRVTRTVPIKEKK